MRTLFALTATVVASLALVGCGPSPAVRHAQSLLDQGDYRGASQYTEAELGKHPDDPGLHRIRLRALLGMGDAAGAVAGYRSWRAAHGGTEDRPALSTMAMTTVWQGVTSPSAALRLTAIRAIERLELEPLARDVGRAMGDDNDQVAAAAAVAVLRSFPQAPEVAEQMLRSDDPVARAIAVEGIGRKVKGLARDDLRALAGDPDPRVRAAVASFLGAHGDGSDRARLVTMAGDSATSVKAAAITALARSGGRDAALATIGRGALADESLAVRLAGLALLEKADPSAMATLTAHADPMIAAQAARAVGDRAAAAPVLDRALAASDVAVRVGAVNLLASALTKDDARTRATAALRDPAPAVQLAAARALAYLGDEATAIAALATLASAGDPIDRAQAAAELARLGDPRGVATLTALGGDADPAVRRAVVGAHLGAGAITAALWSALADDQADTRLDAAITILTLLG